VDPDLFLFLDAPHLGDDRRAAVEETEDRVIDLVDPIAKRLEGLIRHGMTTRSRKRRIIKHFNEFCNGKAGSARPDRGGVSRDARADGLALAVA
jgi:hypothetical protein